MGIRRLDRYRQAKNTWIILIIKILLTCLLKRATMRMSIVQEFIDFYCQPVYTYSREESKNNDLKLQKVTITRERKGVWDEKA